MKREEAEARAIAAEAKKRHEYYIANREHIRERQKAYQKAHHKEYAARSKKYRKADPIRYAEMQIRYWTKKLEGLKNGEIR